DGSTTDLGCTVLRLPEFDKFEGRRMRVITNIARALDDLYDSVVFTDTDEFLIADPARHDGLADFLDRKGDEAAIAPLALNIVQVPRWEAPLDFTRPVLGQRRFAKFAPVMCKPCVNRRGLRWIAASHGVKGPYRVDPELFMVHLKFADHAHLRRTAERRRAMALRDGRGSNATWARSGEDMVEMLAGLTEQLPDEPEAVPEFDPAAVDLEELVVRTGHGYRAPKEGQLKGLAQRAWVRVPERLLGLV
ncbi:MAG TPA: hypothetical protein VD814_02100, partial [Nocardioides sp.]|nr:hypothetical protein [Nocardioides sp.]